MAIAILSRESLGILASEWSPPSLTDRSTPCVDSTNLQYITTPARGTMSLSFKGSGALLNGFTWTAHGSDPSANVRITPDDASVSLSQTGGATGTCNPFTASVSGLDPSQRHTLSIDLTTEDPAAQAFFILSGTLIGAPDTVDDPPNSSSNAETQAPTSTDLPPTLSTAIPATSTGGSSSETLTVSLASSTPHSETPNAPHSGTETRSIAPSQPSGPQRTAKTPPKRSQLALEIGIPMGILGLLLLAASAWLILRFRRRKLTLVPYWNRVTPDPNDAKRDPESAQVPHTVAGHDDSELVALSAVLDQAGLSVHELLELCAQRPITDDQGSSYDGSSLPPVYASEASW